MRVAIGSDHAGFPLKQHITRYLAERGQTVFDLGSHDETPVDYPDVAAAVARAVVDGRADRGIIICGSGAGACVAANKVKGVRGTIAHDTYTAAQCVEHDDCNVLCLGARVIGPALAETLVDAFLGATFTGEDRHRRRLEKVKALEGG